MVKLYADKELQSPLGNIDLGTVEVGKWWKETYYIFNNTNAELHDLDIVYPEEQPEGLEISLPKTINPNSIGELVVTWKPPLTLRKALSVKIEITYKELYIAGE